MIGGYAIKVVRSKTAIVPVNASLLPRTEEEHERCKRTAYVTNIDLDVEVRHSPLLWARGTDRCLRPAPVVGCVLLLRDVVRSGDAPSPYQAGQPGHAGGLRGVRRRSQC